MIPTTFQWSLIHPAGFAEAHRAQEQGAKGGPKKMPRILSPFGASRQYVVVGGVWNARC